MSSRVSFEVFGGGWGGMLQEVNPYRYPDLSYCQNHTPRGAGGGVSVHAAHCCLFFLRCGVPYFLAMRKEQLLSLGLRMTGNMASEMQTSHHPQPFFQQINSIFRPIYSRSTSPSLRKQILQHGFTPSKQTAQTASYVRSPRPFDLCDGPFHTPGSKN